MSNPNHWDIEQLNKVQQGRLMQIEMLKNYLRDSEDTAMRQTLNEMLLKSEEMARENAELIEKMGGQPAADTGIGGVMQDAVNAWQTFTGDNTSLIGHLLDTEQMGIEQTGKIVDRIQSPEAKALVERQMAEDEKMYRQMLQLRK